MESKRTATTYFIPPGKFLLMENALGNPDLIQSSVSSDCRVTIVDKANFPLDELEQWPTFRLVSADIQLKLGNGSYYIYIVVPTPDNEDTTTAFISYNTSLVDRDGYEVIASTDEDGNSVTSKGPLLGKEGFKYYQCGVVSQRGGNSSVTTNPEGQGRLIEVDLGVTPSPSTLPGDLNDFDEIFQLDKVDPSNPASWLLSILTTVKTMVARMVRITGSLVFGQGENERAVTDVATSADKNNEQKIADDVLATTAWTDARFGVLEGKYLRKDQDDRSTGTISSDKGMEVGHFIQGMIGGSGAKMYIDNNGKTIVEADKAYFREEMLVPKITFNSIDVVSGEMAQTFAYGTIKSVDTATQIATLDLLDDEYGTLHVYDILRGTFHRLEGGNNTEYSKDKNGFHNYSGFSTSYFTPTEILVNEKGHMEFRYALQDADGMHPCAGMNFYAYGNFSDKDRQSVTYQTREYTRRLRNMDTWVINPSKNIAKQDGNLNDLEVGNFKMSGWGTFETNSYLIGTQIQFSPDQLEELKGLNGADAYSVTLSSYDGVIKVDATGTKITSGMTSEFNVVTGSMNVVTGDNNVIVADFRLKTVIQVSKGNTPLYFSPDMEVGSYMAFVNPVGCVAEVSSGVVTVTEITNLKNCYVDITVVCEGSHTVEKTYRISPVYDGDSSGIETIYSKLKEPTLPENVHPYVDDEVWSHETHEDNIWMAIATRENDKWTDWQVSRVKGYDAVSYEVSPPVLNLRETLTGTVTPSATVFTCYMSHEDARVEAKAVWGLKGRKTDDGEWDDFGNPYGTEPVSSITFEPNQQNRYVEYLLTATPEGQTTALEVQIISTKDRKGPMPRYCGHFVEGEKYYYNDNYRDIVIYKGNVYQVYPYKPDGYVTEPPSDNLSAEGSHDNNWEMANKFSFVAMDTALINAAHIAGFTFYVDGVDEEGNPLGRMVSSNRKIIIDTKEEKITSTDAEIKGDLYGNTISFEQLYQNSSGQYVLPPINGRYGMFYMDAVTIPSKGLHSKTFVSGNGEQIIRIKGSADTIQGTSITIENQSSIILFSRYDSSSNSDVWLAVVIPYWVFGDEPKDSIELSNIVEVPTEDEATEPNVLYILK